MIGRTETGLPIPCLQKGDPARSTLIFGGIHAREHITVELLLALWKAFEGDMTLVPCLNVDGLILATEGIGALGLSAREAKRLIAVNGGSEDFSLWKADGKAPHQICLHAVSAQKIPAFFISTANGLMCMEKSFAARG